MYITYYDINVYFEEVLRRTRVGDLGGTANVYVGVYDKLVVIKQSS